MRRTEVKFQAENRDLAAIYDYLSGVDAWEAYPERKINSVYLDTPDHRMFRETEEGVTPRSKIRVRWYGDTWPTGGVANLEIKTTLERGREKFSNPVRNTTNPTEPQYLEKYGEVLPVVLVTYVREYFIAHGMRITLDRDIAYDFPDRWNERFSAKFSSSIALEAKNPQPFLEHKLTNELGLRTRHFSKFEEGVRNLGIA